MNAAVGNFNVKLALFGAIRSCDPERSRAQSGHGSCHDGSPRAAILKQEADGAGWLAHRGAENFVGEKVTALGGTGTVLAGGRITPRDQQRWNQDKHRGACGVTCMCMCSGIGA